MKRYWLIWILILSVLLSFAGCTKKPAGTEETAGSGTASDSKGSDRADTPEGTLAALLARSPGGYQMVRSAQMGQTGINILLSFRQTLVRLAGYDVRIVTDDTRIYPEKETEILIGKSARPGTDTAISKGEYRVEPDGERIRLYYGDSADLKDALEYLLTAVCTGSAAADVKNAFAEALQDKGISRYDDFRLRNFFCDGMTLMGSTLCFGQAKAGSRVSVVQHQNQTQLRSTDAQMDAAGNWQVLLPPEEQADRLEIRCNDVTVLQYRNIRYVSETATASLHGMKVLVDGVEQKTFRSSAGNLVVASAKSADQDSMEIVIRRAHRSVQIRPLSAGQEYVSDGQEVRITVREFPKKLSVEFDGSYTESVQLFLYGYDTTDVTALGTDVLYFAPGEYTVAEDLKLRSGQTVYLAEGARLHARLLAENVQDITVMGRGVIDTFPFDVDTNMITVTGCKRVTLQDFSLIGPRKWMVKLENSDDCTVRNMNIVGTEMNSDGVDIVGCSQVTVTGCFLKNNDDCIAVKSWGRNVSGIRVTGNILWNDVYGNAIEIGFETRGDSISDIVFEDNDVIRILGGSVFSIHLGDHATVSDILYRNIRVEDCDRKLIEIYIRESKYSVDTERGRIRNVTFEDIALVGAALGSISIGGFDEGHMTEGITFRNMTSDGRTIPASDVTLLDKKYTKDITWDGQTLVP